MLNWEPMAEFISTFSSPVTFASLQLPSPKARSQALMLILGPQPSVLPVLFGYFQCTVLLTIHINLYFFNHLLFWTLVCSAFVPWLRLQGNTSTILLLTHSATFLSILKLLILQQNPNLTHHSNFLLCSLSVFLFIHLCLYDMYVCAYLYLYISSAKNPFISAEDSTLNKTNLVFSLTKLNLPNSSKT